MLDTLRCVLKYLVAFFSSFLLWFGGGLLWLFSLIFVILIEAFNELLKRLNDLADWLSPWEVPDFYFEPGALAEWIGGRGWMIVLTFNEIWEWALENCR